MSHHLIGDMAELQPVITSEDIAGNVFLLNIFIEFCQIYITYPRCYGFKRAGTREYELLTEAHAQLSFVLNCSGFSLPVYCLPSPTPCYC
jgi:hypothetical protein